MLDFIFFVLITAIKNQCSSSDFKAAEYSKTETHVFPHSTPQPCLISFTTTDMASRISQLSPGGYSYNKNNSMH